MRKKLRRSEERKHFERLLDIRYWEVLDGRDPYEHMELAEENMSDNIVRIYAMCWDEARALVEALEESHLDDEHTTDKKYHLAHFLNGPERSRMRHSGKGDADAPVHSDKTRAEILTRLIEIAHLDFGDDPDEWRRWFKAFDEDDLFPPYR